MSSTACTCIWVPNRDEGGWKLVRTVVDPECQNPYHCQAQAEDATHA